MVSIIVPAFNRELYIEDCIKSVLAQVYTDWELLIIDDGSEDSTVQICNRFAEEHNNIRIFCCQHGGVSAARNTGLKEADGDFVFFLDSDDMIHPCLLSEMMKIMEDKSIGAVCCNLRKFRNEQLNASEFTDFDLSETASGFSVLDGESFIEALFRQDGIIGAIGGKLIRKSCIENLFFNQEISKGEDTYFLYNYALNGGNIATCDVDWYFYRRHDNNSVFVLKNQFNVDDYLRAFMLMYESEKARNNQKNTKTLKWYIIDNTQQLYELAREQKNKVAMKNLRSRMLKTLFSDDDGVATKKRIISFILFAYCNPLHKVLKKFVGSESEPVSEKNPVSFQKGLVSVVTPVYNNEKYLAETLDAILNQTYNKVQMILVDDGSTDSTVEIAESYKKKFADRGYTYSVIRAEHGNASSAINHGLPEVMGEYLIWPDSDDLLTPESIEKRALFLDDNPDYAAVRSLPEYFDTNTREPAKPRETITMNGNEHIFWDIIEGRSYVSCGCYMLRTDNFFKIYPDRKIPEYNVGQNFQMLLPYMYRHNCATIPEAMYQVRVHDGSHSVRKLNAFSQYKVITDFEKLIDEIAVICKISDKEELKRIDEWKNKRRSGFKRRIFNNLYSVRIARKIYHVFKKRLVNTDPCNGCSACYNICPVNAIEMRENKEGFLYPEIDKSKCTDCGLCDKVCPLKDDKKQDEGKERYFGVKAKNDELRTKSSSGGVFSLLAEAVINDNGVVFGACMEDSGKVKHTFVSSYDEIDKIRRTKYVQSEIGDSFKTVKKFLTQGRKVLFVGTPCQCRGLQKYLGKDYDNLLVVDLVCYGVPSPGIWKKYLSYLKGQYGAMPEAFSFRDKRNHDHGHTVVCKVAGEEHCWGINADAYCKKYFQNEIIRPSCHSCNFCTPVRDSDLTIGDFWGIENCNPDFDDAMGASLVIQHSEKGRGALESIMDSTEYFECTAEDAKQPRLCSPTEPSYKREREMLLYRILPFSIWLNKRW